MRALSPFSLVVCFALLTAVPALAHDEVRVPTSKHQVELVFALDTTGSMGGLLDGAKRKIWGIANEVLKAKQRPSVKIGLVAYRDKGDAYVTQRLDLTSDLDQVYETLMSYQPGGGGDAPEHVNAALYDAVHHMSWSNDKGVLRMIFLVGDAPPHMDYQDDVKHPETSKAALKRNIYVNTIQCGNQGDTRLAWQQIAHNTEGKYAAIAHDGGVLAIDTPYDAELRKLAMDLDETFVGYGAGSARQAKKAARSRALSLAQAAPAPAAADRAAVKAKTEADADDDLVALVDERGLGALASMADGELPEELSGKTKAERKAFVEKKAQDRKALQQKIATLSQKRDAYLAAELAKADKSGFDQEVSQMIREEAKRVGLTY